MKLIDALARIMALNQPVIQTRDVAAHLGVENGHASKILERLEKAGHLARLARALWGIPGRFDPFVLPEYLASPFPAYVSLHSALFHHGLITQVPSVIYAVTVNRAARHHTPLGVVSLHHLDPAFFFGYESHGRSGIKIATAEKALMDTFYLGAGRSRGLSALPEIELPRGFRISSCRAMLKRIKSRERRRRVSMRLESLVADIRSAR